MGCAAPHNGRMAERRTTQVEIEVAGTPEQAWRAIATGPGVSSWFYPTKIDGRVGGSLLCLMGPGMEARATIEEWAPPHRFKAQSSDFGPEAPPLESEWTVEPRDGGGCIVRVAHAMETADARWDPILADLREGWPGFFRVLRIYLEHFADQPVALLPLFTAVAVPEPDAWRHLSGSLGLSDAGVGDTVRMAPAGAPELVGVVEHLTAQPNWHEVLVRLADPAPGVFSLAMYMMGGKTQVTLNVFFYGESAPERAATYEPMWRAWLERRRVEPDGVEPDA